MALPGDYLVRGRIDAVYDDDGEWEIVDFKSGGKPDTERPDFAAPNWRSMRLRLSGCGASTRPRSR